jgi:hypothetical protein
VAKNTKTTKKSTKKSVVTKPHPAQTPAGYVITGLIMWLVGYLLFILAVDSGSLLEWLGVLIAAGWGFIRVSEGLYKLISKG